MNRRVEIVTSCKVMGTRIGSNGCLSRAACHEFVLILCTAAGADQE